MAKTLLWGLSHLDRSVLATRAKESRFGPFWVAFEGFVAVRGWFSYSDRCDRGPVIVLGRGEADNPGLWWLSA